MSELGFDYSDYNVYSYRRDIFAIRRVLLISIILYGLFAFVDLTFYLEYIGVFHRIRYFLVIPTLLLSIVISYTKWFEKYNQIVLLIAYLVSGISIVFMITYIGEDSLYFAGLYLVFAVAFFMLRLRPNLVVIGTIIILISFLVIGLVVMDNFSNMMISNLAFYFAFSVIGIYGTYSIDAARKKQYLNELGLTEEKIVLEKRVYKQMQDLNQYHYSSILSIAKLAESRDQYTGNHIIRVGKLSRKLAEALPKRIFKENKIEFNDFVEAISLSSLLHDIGKITVPDLILNKKGKLTSEEFEIMKKHTTSGYDILKDIDYELKDNMFIHLGINIAKSHHERWDGSGYPDCLKEKEIPLEARIVAVVDVYDALISERPYKKAFSKEKSLKIIEEGIGSHFDPLIAKTFIDLLT